MNNEKGYVGLRRCADARVGGFIGLLVGDALGVSFEFKKPEQIPPRDQIEMITPVTFRRSHAGVRAGTYSDDGAQAMCLLASLLDNGRLSLIDFADRLLRWLDEGYLAVDGDVFDVGIQTAEALGKLRDGMTPRESGGASEWDNGNGSVMRCLPLALWHQGPDEALVRDAHLQSLPTISASLTFWFSRIVLFAIFGSIRLRDARFDQCCLLLLNVFLAVQTASRVQTHFLDKST